MAVNLIVGTQWGDEGKAKVIDFLSQKTDVIVRYQGGANAGHTVKVASETYVFHLIPSGILYPNTICVLAGGMVIDPEAFFEELSQIEKRGIQTEGRLRIADNAHLLLPYHRLLDGLKEDSLGENKIGTTRRGIGICYGDKVNRMGIRVGDLFSQTFYEKRLPLIVQEKNKVLSKIYAKEKVDLEELTSYLKDLSKRLKEYVVNVPYYLSLNLESNKRILLEGAQGTMLDLDHGTYPYVTSSNPTTGGALSGSGISYQHLKEVIGITKAYATRVGEGPFPTELHGEEAETMRRYGNEYGASTGRPRRTGWFDVEVLRHAVRVNGLTAVALTKLDILDNYDVIKVSVGYEWEGKRIDYVPSYDYDKVKPLYQEFLGWKQSIENCRTFEELPANAKLYIKALEKFIGVPIRWISVGPGREATIEVK